MGYLEVFGSYYGLVAGGIAVTFIISWNLLRRRRKCMKTFPADTIIVHQFTRGLYVPCASPFALKLETYLRMTKLPYQAHYTIQRSSKGKSPWISYNDINVADSQFCIEFINKKFDLDLDKSLSVKEKAVSLAFRKLLEENFYWCMVMWRWCYDPDKSDLRKAIRLPYLLILWITHKIKQQARGHGLGRHSQEEVTRITEADLRAVSAFLGNKKFFMGDEPTEVDACVFGFLAQVKWQMNRSPMEKLLKDELVNLSAYCDTMKALYWPDWDDCNTDGGRKKATA